MWLASRQSHPSHQRRPLVAGQRQDAVLKVDVPENWRFWPFWATCQVKAPPGWMVKRIELPGAEEPSRARWSRCRREGPCWSAEGGRGQGGFRLGELLEQLGRQPVARLELDDAFQLADRRFDVALGEIVIGQHEPAPRRNPGGRESASRACNCSV